MNSTGLKNEVRKQSSGISFLVKIQVIVAVVALAITIIVVLQIGSLVETKANLEVEIEQHKYELKKIKNEIDTLMPLAQKGLGYRTTTINRNSTSLENSLKASRAASELIKRSSEADRRRRKNITIQYFPKNLDKEVNINIVVPSLQEFGFRVERKRAIVTWVSTNAIWFGSDLKIDDVKLVAYTLIGAGVKIKIISPFKSSKGRKASLIQIGALSIKSGGKNIVEGWPDFTVESIRKATVFPLMY